MNDLSKFSQYHPSSEGRDFTKDEYTSLLNDLCKKKSQEVLQTDGKSIKIAGTIARIWQTIKSLLGLDNQVNPIKVNYQLLKLLRYGENHHYLRDEQVRGIVTRLSVTLEQDKNKSYKKITALISKILPINDDVQAAQLLDREINVFYNDNNDQLKEAFWPKLIRKYSVPVGNDAAQVHYNQAKIYEKEDHLKEAIQSLEKALKILPNKPTWKLALAKLLLNYAENKSISEASELCKKSLMQIEEIAHNDLVLPEEIHVVKEQASLSCAALCVKEEKYDEAAKFLEMLRNEDLVIDPISSYESFISKHLSYKSQRLQVADFYLTLSKSSLYQSKAIPLLEKAIAKFHESYQDANASYIDQQLLKANLDLTECCILSNNINQAKPSLDNAWTLLKDLRSSHTLIFNRFSERFQEQAESLLKIMEPLNDLQGGIIVTLYLKDIHIKDAKKCSICCKSLASLYALSGDNLLAFKELEQAYSLTPSQDLSDRIQELARHLTSSALEHNKHLEAFTYLKKIQALSPTDREALQLLTTVSMKLSNWKEAETWADRWMAAYTKDAEAFLIASLIAVKVGNSEIAAKYAKVAVKIAPDNSKAIIHLFDLTGEIDFTNISEAINTAKSIAKENPNDWRIHLQLGGLYHALKNYDLAQDHLQTAKRLNSKNADVCSALGNILIEKNDYESALKELKLAADLKKTTIPFEKPLMNCYSALANQALARGNYQELFSHYGQMLQLSPSKEEIIQDLYVIGKRLEQTQPSHAATAYKFILNNSQFITLEKTQLIEIYQHLALEEEKVNSFNNAIGLLEAAKNLEPKNIKTLKSLAGCYTTIGDSQQAGKIWMILEELGFKVDESQTALANLYLRQRNFVAALPIFQKQNEISAHKSKYNAQIHDCLIGLALKNESVFSDQAVNQYEQSLVLASKEQKQATASRLLIYGNDLWRRGENDLAFKCFLLGIESAPTEAQLPQQLLAEAYIHLARANIQQKKYTQASELYQKAVAILPNQIELILESAECEYSQGNLERAAFGYRKAMHLQTHVPSHRQKLITTELAIANKNYAKGVHNPERVRQSIVNLVLKATSPQYPHAKKIQTALGAWRQESSSDNIKLLVLGTKAESLYEIENEGTTACELIEKAYDGSWFHMKPSEMPAELSQAIHSLREEITTMRAYYETLQQRTEQLLTSLKFTPFAELMTKASLLPKLKDLNDASKIEEQAKNVLQKIAKAAQNNPLAITPGLDQEIKSLQQLAQPSGWMFLAINHYRNVLELEPQVYGEHHNKLIDAYVKINDFVNAIATYERLKLIFPKAPLKIDHSVYTKIAETSIPQTQVTNQQLVDGLMRAGDQKNQEKNYPEAIRIYNQALKNCTSQQTAAIAGSILAIGDHLINSASRQEAITAYESILPYLNSLNLSNNKIFSLFVLLGNEAQSSADFEKALNYYKKGLAINQQDAKINAIVGSLYFAKNDLEQALSYLEKALSIEPLNLGYLRQLADVEIALGDHHYIQSLLSSQSEVLRNLVRFVTIEASYANKIKSALGKNLDFLFLGSLSHENRKLSNLGTSISSAKQIAVDCTDAFKLIQTAYDGKSNHNMPEDMPEELRTKLDVFQAQLASFQSAIKNIPEEVQNKSKLPMANTSQQAISYYEKAKARFPATYGIYYNRLIDSYAIQGEFFKALTLFNNLKKTFPGSSIQITAVAFQRTFKNFMDKGDYQTALKIIENGLAEFPDSLWLKKSKSDFYFYLGKIQHNAKNFDAAVMLYTLATKCGIDAKLDCYINLAKIYLQASYKQIDLQFNKSFEINDKPPSYSKESILDFIDFTSFAANEYPNHFQASVTNLKKAVDLDKNNAELRFQLGRISYLQQLNFDIVPYLQEALRLKPHNVSYAYALLMTMMNKYNLTSQDPQVNDVLQQLYNNGGSIINGDEEYWTLSNPYEFPVEN